MAITLKGSGQVIVQIVQTVKTDTFSASINSTWTDITGMSVNITPTSSSNKVLVLVNIGSIYASNNGAIKLLRDSTDIFLGNAGTSQTRASIGDVNAVGLNAFPASFSYIDSPATTSSITYKIQGWVYQSSTLYINQGSQDSANSYRFRTASTITAMEISG